MNNLITQCTPSFQNGQMNISTLTNKSTVSMLQEYFPKNKLFEIYKSNIHNLFTSITDNQSLFLSVKLINIIYKINPTENIETIDIFLNKYRDEIHNIKVFRKELDLLTEQIKDIYFPSSKQSFAVANNTAYVRKKDKKGLSEKLNKKMDAILIDNQDSKIKFSKILITISKIRNLDTNDKPTIEHKIYLLNLDNKSLEQYLLTNHNTFSNLQEEPKSGYGIIMYEGAKFKDKCEIQTITEMVLKGNTIKRHIEAFQGAGGSLFVAYPILKENGIDEVIVNDWNPLIANLHKHLHKNHLQVQKEIAEIVRQNLLKYGTLHLEKEEEKEEIFEELLKRLNEDERQKIFTPKTIATYLFLSATSRGGNYGHKDGVSVLKYSNTTSKFAKFYLIINRVDVYNKLYNSFKSFKVLSKDYENILKKYDSEDTHIHFDPPYNDCDTRDKSHFKEGDFIPMCSANYGDMGEDFALENLLINCGKLKSKFVYINYAHPSIQYYTGKFKFNSFTFEKLMKNGAKPVSKFETIMFSQNDNLISTQGLNKTDYFNTAIHQTA